MDDSVDNEEDDDGNMNDIIFGTERLNPNFLLIEDEDEVADSGGTDDKKENSPAKTLLVRRNFLVDDEEINGYNDTIEVDPVQLQKGQKRSLVSAWSLSSSSSSSEHSSFDRGPVDKRCHEMPTNAARVSNGEVSAFF